MGSVDMSENSIGESSLVIPGDVTLSCSVTNHIGRTVKIKMQRIPLFE